MRRGVLVLLLAILIVPWAALPDEDGGGVGTSITVPTSSVQGEATPAPDRALALEGNFFVENVGQLDDAKVRYFAQDGELSVGLRREGVTFTLREASQEDLRTSLGSSEPTRVKTFTVLFEGANRVCPVGVGPLGHRTNYMIGNDPEGWTLGVRSFAEVHYEGIYDGVDLRFYFKDGMLKYDFSLDALVDPNVITLRYTNVEGLELDPGSGDLMVATGMGTIRDKRPVVYQEGTGHMVPHDGEFVLIGDRSVRFHVPDECPPSAPLVIDPGIEFSTFLGGAEYDLCMGMDVDGSGNVYVVGMVDSMDFQTTPGALNERGWVAYTGLEDAIVAKLDPTGSELLFATYLGGYNDDMAIDVKARPDGRVVVSGATNSVEFPVTDDAILTTHPRVLTGYLVELSKDGSELLYGTFLGGAKGDGATNIALDDDGNVYVAGWTSSLDFPTTQDAFCTTLSPHPTGWIGDVFVLKMSPSHSLVYSTYVGGQGLDEVCDIRLDASGSLLVAGYTVSDPFLTLPGGFETRYGGGEADGYIFKLSPDGSSIEGWTYIGGALEDRITAISVCPNGTLYACGVSKSVDLPATASALQSHNRGDWDGFVCQLDAALDDLGFLTYFGGSEGEWIYGGLAIDHDRGVVHIAGRTLSSDLATTEGCYDTEYRGGTPWFKQDAFVASLDLSGRSLVYSTYLGVLDYESVTDIELTGNGSLVLLVHSDSGDFPITRDAFCSTLDGDSTDFLIVGFDPTPCDLPDPPRNLQVHSGDGYVSLSWDGAEQLRYRTLGYVVYKGVSLSDMARLTELDGTEDGFLDEAVVNGRTYYYGVAALNSAGEGDANVTQGRPLALPTAPRGLGLSTGDDMVNLTWETPICSGGEILGYHVLRGMTTDYLVPRELNEASTCYVDSSVQTGRTYYYAVRAFNSRGVGPMSEVVGIRATGPPEPPSDFWLVEGDGCARLNWGPPIDSGGTDVLGYRVYRGLTPTNLVHRRELSPTTFSHRDVGCENGIRYYYQLTTLTEMGESEPSPLREAVPFGLPSEPRFLVAEAGDAHVSLSWSEPIEDNGRSITGYRVYYGESPGSLAFSATVDNTRYQHVGAVNGITYYYEVAAINEAGEGLLRSETVSATPMGLPGRPTDLVAGSILDSIRLKWSPPDDGGGSESLEYRVYRGASQDAMELLAEVGDCGELYDRNVKAGTVYYYAVRAVNPVGEGAASTAVSGILLTEPGAVRDLEVRYGDGFVELRWTHPGSDGGSDILGYRILKGTVETSLSQLPTSWTGSTFNDTSVENGVTYHYQVRAENAVGRGPPSIMVSATPLGQPGRVGMLDARVREDGILLEWTGPCEDGCVPVTGYVVLRGLAPGNLSPLAHIEDELTYLDTNARPGTTYYYCVVANSTLGAGPPSEIVMRGIEAPVEDPEHLLGIYALGLLLASVLVAGIAWRRTSRGRGPSDGGEETTEALAGAEPGEGLPLVAEDDDEPCDHIVEKVFVVYQDGRLMVEAARQDRSEGDASLMSGLLVATQSIVQYGLEDGSSLESIKYGDNLILISGGRCINLATVIYGKPSRSLVARLESTVRQIEDHYSDILETWSGDQADVLGALALIAPLVESTEHLAREDVDGATSAHEVSLLSAVDFHRGYVRLKVVAVNATDEQIADAAIEIRYDPDMLRVERVEPERFCLRGDRVVIGRIDAGKSQTVSILMDPQICLATHIDGTFTYYDVGGKYHRMDMKRCHADVVCPVFFTRKNANTAMLRRMIRERLKVTEFRVFRYPKTMAPGEMLSIGKAAVGESDVQLVREYVVGGPPYEAEVWYYGETKARGLKIVMRLGVIEEKNAVELFAASTAMEPITGLLAEFRRSLNELMRERYSKGLILELERDESLRIDLERRELLIDREEGKGPDGA